MARFDLDARRAEQKGEDHVVRLGGHDYHLPPRLPIAIAQPLVEGRTYDAIAMLFGPEAAPTIAATLSNDELEDLCVDLYGVALGEAPRSPEPSPSNGTRSTRTSPASTRST